MQGYILIEIFSIQSYLQMSGYIPAPTPMKMRQTINTTKAFGNTIIQVARIARTEPQYQIIFLPKLSDIRPPTNKATNIPTQKHD